METPHCCPECGAAWTGDVKCLDHFYQMGLWEWEIFHERGPIPEIHYLMVLSYHLQHPSLYSPEALRWGMRRLAEYVEKGVGPEEVRRRQRLAVDSGKRAYKVRGTPESHGTYKYPVKWTMTAADVIAGGVDRYCDNVKAWAVAVYQALADSGNLADSSRNDAAID